jgi:pyruvate/2-oxoglutarate dehydrogenase complex dihydrolipoamide dehydrogenase (E3) component
MSNEHAAASPLPPEQQTLARLIGEMLRRHGDDALQNTSVEAAARAWLDAGFTDAEEVDEWLVARCFDPRHAQALEAAGVTPEQGALSTREGRADYEETVAYKFSRGDLTLAEVRRIITNDFWNS